MSQVGSWSKSTSKAQEEPTPAKMDDLTLHQMQISGNSYKIRLTAALLGIKLKKIDYDVRKGETRTPEFLSNISAGGRVPVLQIGKDKFLPESNAAMVYLASESDLIPNDRFGNAEMLRWMFFEQYSHEPSIATVRWWTGYLGVDNLTEEQKILLPGKRRQGEEALDVMDRHLSKRKFFVAERLTLADIVLYAYTHLAGEGGFDLARWPNVKAWCERIAQTRGYISVDE